LQIGSSSKAYDTHGPNQPSASTGPRPLTGFKGPPSPRRDRRIASEFRLRVFRSSRLLAAGSRDHATEPMAGRRRSSRGARRAPAPSTDEPALQDPADLGPVLPPFPKPSMHCLSVFGWMDMEPNRSKWRTHACHVYEAMDSHAWPPVRCCDPLLVGVLRVILDPSWHSVSNKHYSVSFYSSVQKHNVGAEGKKGTRDTLLEYFKYHLECRAFQL